MNGKKLLLIVSFIVLLLVGWIFTMRAMTGVEVREKQNELVAQADEYAGKELYIRAIPLYEEALNLKTDENSTIEKKLLSCYYGSGDSASYLALVALRVDNNRAEDQEYIQAAEYYINSYEYDEAMKLVKRGIDQLNSESLKEYYETNRYSYTMISTKYQEILPTATNELMPVFDGDKWGFVNSRGRLMLEPVYDKVVPFNTDGYAAVQVAGTYYVILTDGAKYGVDETGISDVAAMTEWDVIAKVNGKYGYYNYDFQCVAENFQFDQMSVNACGLAAVRNGEKWSIITDAGETILDFVLDDVALNSLGAAYAGDVAMVKMGDAWYLINTAGEKISEKGYANAKAPESDGFIAVANEEGLWGFIDQTGKEVIPCEYQDAKSFSDHVGAVEKLDGWKYISESNQVIIDEILEDAQPFHNGVAQAGFVDGIALIKLDYVEE